MYIYMLPLFLMNLNLHVIPAHGRKISFAMPAMSNESNSSSSGGGPVLTPGGITTQSVTFGAAPVASAGGSGAHGGVIAPGVTPWSSLPETFSYEKGTMELERSSSPLRGPQPREFRLSRWLLLNKIKILI